MELKGAISRRKINDLATTHYTTGHHKIPRTWIIVADSHIAQIYSKAGESLKMIGEAYPSKAPVRTASDEKNNTVPKSNDGKSHIQYEPSMSPQRRKTYRFAHEISDWLGQALYNDAFDRLVLVAPPHMLGDMRKTMTKSVASRLLAEVNKDLTKLHEQDLKKNLEKVVWF